MVIYRQVVGKFPREINAAVPAVPSSTVLTPSFGSSFISINILKMPALASDHLPLTIDRASATNLASKGQQVSRSIFLRRYSSLLPASLNIAQPAIYYLSS